MLQQILDRISENPLLWNTLRWIVEAGFRGEKEVIARELGPWNGDGRRILDLGCGTGEFASCFPAQAYLGVDLSSAYIRFAGRARPGSFAVMSGVALGVDDERFDAALVLGVLHHMPDDVARAAAAELRRVLKPGATLLVLEDIPPPSRWNLAGRLMHWLDRGDFIRGDADYRALFWEGFEAVRSYSMRSGICDYGVYVLRRSAVEREQAR